MMVTEERFVFAFGAGGDPRKIAWSDREDNDTWTPAATNEAGDIQIQTNRSEEHTSELQSGYISYAVFCLKKKKKKQERERERKHGKTSAATITPLR